MCELGPCSAPILCKVVVIGAFKTKAYVMGMQRKASSWHAGRTVFAQAGHGSLRLGMLRLGHLPSLLHLHHPGRLQARPSGCRVCAKGSPFTLDPKFRTGPQASARMRAPATSAAPNSGAESRPQPVDSQPSCTPARVKWGEIDRRQAGLVRACWKRGPFPPGIIGTSITSLAAYLCEISRSMSGPQLSGKSQSA